MPRINIRLTEEQHEQLRTESFQTRNSIQDIVIKRLFYDSPKGAETTSPTAPTAKPLQLPVDRPVAKPGL